MFAWIQENARYSSKIRRDPTEITLYVDMYVDHTLYIVYAVPTISRLLQITGLFCRISSVLWGSFATKTYHFQEPTNRSHPICVYGCTESHICM